MVQKPVCGVLPLVSIDVFEIVISVSKPTWFVTKLKSRDCAVDDRLVARTSPCPGGGAGANTVIERARAGEVVTASFTVTLKLNGLPVVVVGVPLMTPLEALRLRPAGRAPDDTVHEL